MANFAPVRLSLGALLLAKICYGQDTSSEDMIFSALATPSDVEPHATPVELGASPTAFNYPPGEYPINDSVYIVACESQTMEGGLTPFAISLIAQAITDFGDCMAFCDQLGDKCDLAEWDVTKDHPCVLLTDLTDEVDTIYGRCYAQKSPSVSIDPILPSTDSASSEFPTSSPSSRPYPPSLSSSSTSFSDPPFTDFPSPTTYPGPRSLRSSSTASLPAPSGSDQLTRTNAFCGVDHGDIPFTSCPPDDPIWGRCCSRFGFCGSSAQYCGDGCQEDFGSCDGDFDPETTTDFPFPSTIFLSSMTPPEPVGTLVAKGCDDCHEMGEME